MADFRLRAPLRVVATALAVVVLHAAFAAAPAAAQTLSIGGGAEYDRFTYHFDNPSTYDTSFQVAHFFEQRYVADNLWLTGRVRYRAGLDWETSAGITPQRTGTGDDYDTFFNPNGVVVVTGTTGGISIWSWRIGQRGVVFERGAWSVLTGYRLRVDRADWQLGHSTTTVNGILIDAHDTIDHEYTESQMHQVLAGWRLRSAAERTWQTTLDAEVAPVAAGRLSIRLPEKYPGRDIVYISKGGAVTVTAALARRTGRLPFTVSGYVLKTWKYRATASLERTTAGVTLTIY